MTSAFANALKFHVDACPPRQPQAKGKVERRVRDQRHGIDPYARSFGSIEELQAWTDERIDALARERRCPATGTTVAEAWDAEKRLLTPLRDPLPVPFDIAVSRRVGIDGLISFEGRQYSVLFRLIGQNVEVRGIAGAVQVLKSCEVVAEHPRGTAARLLIDQAHYDGPSDDRVIAPPPLGRMGRKVQELIDAPVAHRAIETYHLLVEVARCAGPGHPRRRRPHEKTGGRSSTSTGPGNSCSRLAAPMPPSSPATCSTVPWRRKSRHRPSSTACSRSNWQAARSDACAPRSSSRTCRPGRRSRASAWLSLQSVHWTDCFTVDLQPAIERSRIETLATGAWVRSKETVLLQGPPGVGKTHLAVSLGVKAVQLGFSAQYYRFEELMTALKGDADMPPARLRRRKYMSTALLIIDELGFEVMSREEASARRGPRTGGGPRGSLFRLITYRYDRGAILITTNKSVRDWTELLAGDEVLAAAILDRLLHRSNVPNIKGRSYRLRDLDDLLKKESA